MEKNQKNPQDEKALILATVKESLPSLLNHEIVYNDIAKMFLTPAWRSAAGNSYQQGVRISDVLVAEYEIGHGHAWTFMNGIRIYRFEDRRRVLIGERYFYRYKWSDYGVKEETARLLSEYIGQQYRLANGADPNPEYIRQISQALVAATVEKTRLIGA